MIHLSDAQWAMLDRLMREGQRWVDTRTFDHRTLNSLITRRLVMPYPYNEARELSHVTQQGRSLWSAWGYVRRRLERGLPVDHLI